MNIDPICKNDGGVSGAGVGGGWNVAQALGTSRGVSGRSLGKYVGTRL